MRIVFAMLPVALLFSCSEGKFAGRNDTGKAVKNTSSGGAASKDATVAEDKQQASQNTPDAPTQAATTPVQAAADVPAPAPAAPSPNTCYVDEEAAFYLDLSGNAPKRHQYMPQQLELVFNSDAFDFDITVTQVVVDDGWPMVDVEGQRVIQQYEGERFIARVIDVNVHLNNLHGGTNKAQGNFYDKNGVQAKLSIKLRGTWKTYQGCHKDFNRRYAL